MEKVVWVKERVGGGGADWGLRGLGSPLACVHTHMTSNIQHLGFSFTQIPLSVLVTGG